MTDDDLELLSLIAGAAVPLDDGSVIDGGELADRVRAVMDARDRAESWREDWKRAAIGEGRERDQYAEKVSRIESLVRGWPDGNERMSEYARARGQCKRAVLAALEPQAVSS